MQSSPRPPRGGGSGAVRLASGKSDKVRQEDKCWRSFEPRGPGLRRGDWGGGGGLTNPNIPPGTKPLSQAFLPQKSTGGRYERCYRLLPWHTHRHYHSAVHDGCVLTPNRPIAASAASPQPRRAVLNDLADFFGDGVNDCVDRGFCGIGIAAQDRVAKIAVHRK